MTHDHDQGPQTSRAAGASSCWLHPGGCPDDPGNRCPGYAEPAAAALAGLLATSTDDEVVAALGAALGGTRLDDIRSRLSRIADFEAFGAEHYHQMDLADRMARAPAAATDPDVIACAAAVFDAIRADMDRGAHDGLRAIPLDLDSFARLHDYRDANMIVARQVPYEPMDCDCGEYTGPDSAHGDGCSARRAGGSWEAWTGLCNAVADEVDRLLAGQAARRRAAVHSPEVEDEIRTVQEGMIGAAEAHALPGRFTAAPEPGRPAMRITDHDTGREAVVSLYAYGPARELLAGLFPAGQPGVVLSPPRIAYILHALRLNLAQLPGGPAPKRDHLAALIGQIAGLYAQAPAGFLTVSICPPGLVPHAGTRVPGPAINLAARFTLDEAAARDYIGRIIAAHGSREIPADDSPRFGTTWDPRGPDEEATVARLVRYAADHGIIGRPEGMNLDFVYNPDASDGGQYHFAVDIGHDFVDQVTLQSWPTEMRKLVDDEAGTGADAAMSILGEAVARANRVLDKLAALTTDHARTGVLDKLAALITDYGRTGTAATCCPYHSYTGQEARGFVLGLADEEMDRTDDAFAGAATTDDYLVDVIRHLNRALAAGNKLFADE